MKKQFVVAAVGIAALVTVAGCGTPASSGSSNSGGNAAASGATNTPATNAAPSSTTGSAASTLPVSYSVKVETGKMDGKKGWPEIVPANMTLPANQNVTILIHSYDDGNAPIPEGDNVVKGTQSGTMLLNGKAVKSVPTADVAHTITIPTIGLNIPIPVKTSSEPYSTVEFTFHTPATGEKLHWQCMAACGSGASGWGGAMATNGWMQGVWTVQ
ncbi:hypothetical protein D2Q93_09675 [Alicyclobacillaceae bacterium I2511]|jgi:hypothetical protein|nr:hypothetical protein D2Q93_09675 [Alicyclobacillaceae bacterium I2511]